MKKIIEINTIEDYIGELDNLETDNYYFRGEASLNFDKVIASAYRPYKSLFNNSKVYMDYQKNLDEFYLEIGHELTEIERVNFLHYAQHYGMSTPLVDITSNPLTALYFATSSNFKENSARVHVYNKDRFLDFSLFEDKNELNFNKFFYNNNFTRDMYTSIAELSDSIKDQLIIDCANNLNQDQIRLSFKRRTMYIGTELFPTIGEVIDKAFDKETSQSGSLLSEIIDQFKKHFSYNMKYDFDKKLHQLQLELKNRQCLVLDLPKYWYSDDKFKTIIIITLIYAQVDFLREDLSRGGTHERYLSLDDRYDVVCPLIVMHPSVKFGRIKSQEGTFLYQIPHYLGNTKKYFGFSKINSDVELIIKDKEKVFRTLNKMGINHKTIFPDHDNVAAYIKIKNLM